MKHVIVLSKEMPVRAQETAWFELKNIIGFAQVGLGILRQVFAKTPTPPASDE
ncbi:MAG: hypothetical protein HZB26_15485 [Candidatus Hydrogenedentes bacterium]|nr:hypothetical protein [Candidatus Hydrogenedentota bacterium]